MRNLMKNKLLFSALVLVALGCNKPPEVCNNGIDEDENGLTDCEDVAICGAELECQIAGQAVVTQAEDINGQNANNATFSIFGLNVQKIDGNGDGTIDVTVSILGVVASDQENICDQIPDATSGVLVDGTTDFRVAVKVELGDVAGGFANNDIVTDGGGVGDIVGLFLNKVEGGVTLMDASDGSLDNQNPDLFLDQDGTLTIDSISDQFLTATLTGEVVNFDKIAAIKDTDFDGDGVNDALQLAAGVGIDVSVTNAVRCANVDAIFQAQ
jgi:hypothetical protein